MSVEPTLGSRLGQYMKDNEITPYKINKETGISQTTIGRILKDDGTPNKSTIDSICSHLGINKEWLYTGEGEVKLPDSKGETNTNNINVNDPFEQYFITSKNGHEVYNLPDGSYLMKVPLFPIEAYAKYISEGDSVEVLENTEYVYFNVDRIGLGKYRGFRIKGDSFWNEGGYDTPDKAIVLAREVGRQHWKDGFRDSPYGWVIFTKHNGVLKDIVHQDLVEGIITCHSRNPSPEYSDFKLSLDEDVKSIWRVIKRQF